MQDEWDIIELQPQLSDDENTFLRGALLLGISGAVLSIVLRFGHLALFHQYFSALPQDRQFWMLLISVLGTPMILSSFAVATGGYAFLRRNGSRYGIGYVIVFLLPYVISPSIWNYFFPSYLNAPFYLSFLYSFILTILLLQVRNIVSNRFLLIAAATIELASMPLITLLNYILAPVVLALDTPMSFTVSYLPSVVIHSLSVLLLGLLFIAELRRNQISY